MIRFHLLRVDSGAEHLLGFAKKKAMEMAGDGDVNTHRTWNLQGVTLTIKVIGLTGGPQVAKISLVNEDSVYFNTALIPSPCKCRSLHILYTSPAISVGFRQLGTVSSQFSCTGNYGVRGGYQLYVNYLSGGWVLNGVGGGGAGYDDTCYTVTFTSPLASPLYLADYQARVAAAIAAAGPRAIRVVLTDGTELANTPVAFNLFGTPTNLPVSTIWSGGGYVDLHDGSRMTFIVPDDVCRPSPPDNPYDVAVGAITTGLPSNITTSVTITGPNGPAVFSGTKVTDFATGAVVFTQFYNYNGDGKVRTGLRSTALFEVGADGQRNVFPAGAENLSGVPFIGTAARIEDTSFYQSVLNSADLDWIAARAASDVHERQRRKTCSNNMLATINDLAPINLFPYLRQGRIYSNGVYMSTLMSVSVVDGSTGSGDDINLTKVVTLSYQYTDALGVTRTATKTINCAKHVVITRCADSHGLPNAASYTTTTYSSWIPVDANGVTGNANKFDFVRDVGNGMCEQWDGIVVSGAASVDSTFDSYGALYSPPLPLSTDARVFSYPQIYKDYRVATKRAYATNGRNLSWRDSAFSEGEIIDVILLATIHSSLGDLGLFPQPSDIANTALLSLSMSRVRTYKYRYATGSFVFVQEQRVVDSHGVSSAVTLPYIQGVNAVYKSSKTLWPDVRSKYLEQAARLKATHPVPSLDESELFFQKVIAAYTQLAPL